MTFTAADVAVVIPTMGRWDLLQRELHALRGQDVQGFAIVVVSDGGGDPPFDPGAATVLVQDCAGPAGARNAGARTTDGALLLFLDDDVIPEPGLVSAHLAAHNRDAGGRRAVMGAVDWHPESSMEVLRPADRAGIHVNYSPARGGGGRIAPGGHRGSRIAPGRYRGSHVAPGDLQARNLSVSRAVFDQVGGFDPGFVGAGEGADFGLRLAAAGVELEHDPAARGLHLAHHDWSTFAARLRRVAIGDRLLVDRHPAFQPPLLGRFEDAGRGILPGRRLAARLAPTYLDAYAAAGDLVELRHYLGPNYDPRLLIHHRREVEREVAAARDMGEFYRSSQLNLYDLTAFALSGTKDPYLDAVRAAVKPGARLLDYGCGIGSDGLRLTDLGYRVEFADYRNPGIDYLRWRLRQRGLDLPVHDLEGDVPGGFDLVYSFDVLEHVEDPMATLAELERRARLVAVNLLADATSDNSQHHELPIEEIVERARARGLVSDTIHHGRSRLLLYRGMTG